MISTHTLIGNDDTFSILDGYPDTLGWPKGWIVVHKKTGFRIWTGGAMSTTEAKVKILKEIEYITTP